MKKLSFTDLSRRERQIMDIIYKNKEVTAAELMVLLPDMLTNSGVRTLLRVLVNKGFLQRKEKGLKYVYYPTIPLEKAQTSVLKHVKHTYFSDSAERVMTALMKNSDLTEKDFDKLIEIIKQARKKGK